MLPMIRAQRESFDRANADAPAPVSQSGEQSTAAGEQTGA